MLYNNRIMQKKNQLIQSSIKRTFFSITQDKKLLKIHKLWNQTREDLEKISQKRRTHKHYYEYSRRFFGKNIFSRSFTMVYMMTMKIQIVRREIFLLSLYSQYKNCIVSYQAY